MQSQVYFEDLRSFVLQELENATHSIQIAVPVLSDSKIFDLLCNKASKNVHIELLLSNQNANTRSGLAIDTLIGHGATIAYSAITKGLS